MKWVITLLLTVIFLSACGDKIYNTTQIISQKPNAVVMITSMDTSYCKINGILNPVRMREWFKCYKGDTISDISKIPPHDTIITADTTIIDW